MISNGSVAPATRTAACELMDALYIDRQPHFHTCGRPETPFVVWEFKGKFNSILSSGLPSGLAPPSPSISKTGLEDLKKFTRFALFARLFFQSPNWFLFTTRLSL